VEKMLNSTPGIQRQLWQVEKVKSQMNYQTTACMIGWAISGVLATFNLFLVKRKCFQLSALEGIIKFPCDFSKLSTLLSSCELAETTRQRWNCVPDFVFFTPVVFPSCFWKNLNIYIINEIRTPAKMWESATIYKICISKWSRHSRHLP